MVDDADDAGVHRGFDGIKREARFLATDKKHFFADAGATESTAMSVRPAGCRSGVIGWMISSLRPVRLSSFLVTTTSPMTRARCMASLEFDGVDDADDGGVDGTIFHARSHARRAAADDEHGFADPGVHGVDGHEVSRLRACRGDPSAWR